MLKKKLICFGSIIYIYPFVVVCSRLLSAINLTGYAVGARCSGYASRCLLALSVPHLYLTYYNLLIISIHYILIQNVIFRYRGFVVSWVQFSVLKFGNRRSIPSFCHVLAIIVSLGGGGMPLIRQRFLLMVQSLPPFPPGKFQQM